MPKVILTVGLPGSGKSTWRSKFIADNPSDNWVEVSSDDIIDDWAKEKGLTYSEAFSKINQKWVTKTFFERITKAVDAGRNIIVDRTNMTPKGRGEVLKRLNETYHTTAVIFIIPSDELARRLKHRAETTGKEIPDFVIKNMANSYVAPTLDEFDEIIQNS